MPRVKDNEARIMHKFSTAATKTSVVLCAPTVLRDPQAGAPGLLNVLQRVRLRGPLSRVAQRTQVGVSLRYENLCIIRAKLTLESTLKPFHPALK